MPRPRTRASRPSAGLAGLIVSTALLAACGGTAGAEAERALPPRGPAGPAPASSPAAAECTPAPLATRAAAVLVVGLPGVDSADDPLAQSVVDAGVGGVFLAGGNVRSAEQVSALARGLRARAGRPLLVSTDEEGGRVAVMRAVVGRAPAPRQLAAALDPPQVREHARSLGARLAAVGVDLDLAPVLDLDDGPSRGIVGDRAFSADPDAAARFGLAYATGLADSGVHPTVKHFPGQGASAADTHRVGDVVAAPLDELRRTHLAPFAAAVDAGVPVVMLNHLSYAALDPSLPASMSPRAYALLRELGFEGVAITDSIGMGAVNLRWDFPDAAVRAVRAGADAVLATDGAQAARMRDALVAAVRSGALPEARLSQAAARVTALAGGDPVALACAQADLPVLERDGGR